MTDECDSNIGHLPQSPSAFLQEGSLDVQDMTAMVFALGIFVVPVILIGFTLMGWFLFIE